MWRAAPDTRPEAAGDYLGFFVTSTGFDVVAWVLPAVLLLVVTQLFGLADKFSRLVVINNWFGLFSAYIGFFPAALRYLTPVPDGRQRLHLAGRLSFVIWLYFRVVRISVEGDR
jgi:hypothetical protein